jgi:glycosyltransferase involved in cell wall biosynthesis
LKPKILILTDWFVPGYKAGGPIQSVNNMVERLQNEIEFHVLTGDRDLLDSNPYAGVEFNQWVKTAGHLRMYTTFESRQKIILEALKEDAYQGVYLNSFFSLDFSIRPLLALRRMGKLNKVILAPRGMLGAGALKIKGTKKKAFIWLFNLLNIAKRIRIHSTDKSESEDILMALGNVSISEISNLPAQMDAQSHSGKNLVPKFLFASRVSPKKNLFYALEQLNATGRTMKINVYGQEDDSVYAQKCRNYQMQNASVTFHGAVPPVALKTSYLTHDFFILPTMNENFGHAIIEALSFGVPVIISDQCPWIDVESYGAGWVIPLNDAKRWQACIDEAAIMSDAEYLKMSERAQQYVHDKINFDDIRNQYLNLFSETS